MSTFFPQGHDEFHYTLHEEENNKRWSRLLQKTLNPKCRQLPKPQRSVKLIHRALYSHLVLPSLVKYTVLLKAKASKKLRKRSCHGSVVMKI